MSKNPYEVRLDVMKMAQEMLDREKEIETVKFERTLEHMRDNHARSETIREFIDSNAPKSYTDEDVITRATTLYSFVSSSK